MPVRKIPKTYRSISGRFPSILNNCLIGYESKLERDFFVTLEFDRTILRYEEQPVRITGVVGGKKISYVPDCLIQYLDEKPGRLVEVKSTEDLELHRVDLERRFMIAREYASERSMVFEVVTEKEIYRDVFENYRFIYRFAKPPRDLDAKRKQILKIMELQPEQTLKELLTSLSADRFGQASFSSTIWHLLYLEEITVDMGQAIGYSSVLRLPNG